MRYNVFIAAGLFLLAISCTNNAEKDILGSWRAFDIREEGDSLAVDPAEVRFAFGADGRYDYQSTLNYREAGTFEVRGEYLLTLDTTRADAREKAVRIERLSADTLLLGMEEAGKHRELQLVRQAD